VIVTRRRYSDEDRAAALAALAANSGNAQRTAEQLGIPETTVRRWSTGERHPEAGQMSDQKKGPLADRLEEVAHALAGGITTHIADAKLADIAVALGIVIEKMRLLRDQTTSNAGDGLSDDERAARLAALLDLARARQAAAQTSTANRASAGTACQGP